jgi:hypothetical protein
MQTHVLDVCWGEYLPTYLLIERPDCARLDAGAILAEVNSLSPPGPLFVATWAGPRDNCEVLATSESIFLLADLGNARVETADTAFGESGETPICDDASGSVVLRIAFNSLDSRIKQEKQRYSKHLRVGIAETVLVES